MRHRVWNRRPVRTVAPRLMSTAEAAIYLGRTVRAIEHMVRRGQVPVVRSGRKVQFDREALDKWIRRNTEREKVDGDEIRNTCPKRPTQPDEE